MSIKYLKGEYDLAVNYIIQDKMNKNVYKTKKGRNIVESAYKKILNGYSLYPYEQLYIPAKTANTHVIRFGDKSKPPLIMIHGTMSNNLTWLASMSNFIDDFCVYCVDIPGEPGLSEPNRCTFKSDEPYEWLNSLLDSLGIKKAYFTTLSIGSWYALNFAIKSPERIIALSMLTAAGLVPVKTSFLFKAVFYLIQGKTGQKKLNKAIYHNAEMPVDAIEFQAIASKHINPVMDILPIFSDADLKKITFPIQYFGGDCDRLIDSFKTAKRLKKNFSDSDIHILKDTGHVIADQFYAIKTFLLSNMRKKSLLANNA
ncbi:MAG: alpha/beta fold hydrolase [Saccharofermentanales bacterium]